MFNFVAVFVNRPVFTYVLFLISLIIGLVNFSNIPIEEEPNIPNNTYYIRANYSSSLAGIEHNISQPLERGLITIPGVELVTSDVSHTGCLMQVVFAQDSVQSENLLRIQDAILGAKHELPNEAIITTSDNNSGAEGIMTLYFTADKKVDSKSVKELSEISKFIQTRIKNALESINGVSAVNLRANIKDSFTMELIPQNMYMYGIPYSSVEQFLRNIGITGSSCQISSGNSVTNINICYDNNDIENYPVVKDNDKIRVKDIAHINKTIEKKQNISRINGEEAVTVEIQKKPDANLIQVCELINHELIKIRKMCEANGIFCGVSMDKSEFVKRGMHSVYKAIVEAIVLVCIIIFIFLRSLVLSVIPAIAIPLSIIPAFAFMKFFGTTINVYSLFGIVLAIGLVVDDAIVVIENIHKFTEMGYSTKDAAIQGTQRILKSIIAMTITLAIVYMPIFFVNDQNIKSFIDFVVTITVSVLISGVVALTITPTIFSQIYTHKHEHTKKSSWFSNLNIMRRIETWYLKSLSFLMKFRYSIFLVIYFIIICVTLVAYQSIKFEENIDLDRGSITFGVNSKRENDINIEYIDQKMQDLSEKIRNQRFSVDITDITTNVSETMKGNDYLKLKLEPHSKRKYSIQEIISKTLELSKETASDCSFYTSMGTSDYKTFEFFLQVYGESEYKKIQEKYQKFMSDPELGRMFFGVLSTDIKYNRAYQFAINREECARYSVQPVNILEALTSINQHKFFRKPINKDTHKLYIDTLSPETQDKLQDILNLPVEIRYWDDQRNQYVPGIVAIRNFIKVSKESDLNRKMFINGVNGLGIQVRLNAGVSKTDFYKKINEYNNKQDGSFYLKTDIKEERKIQAMQRTISVFIVAIILIYLTLAALFESFIAPLSIMLTVPGSALGSLLMLLWFGKKLNIASIIGLITLVGLITKHGIMMVEYVVSKQNTVIIDQLLLQAAINRLQPIIMTTLCMIIGSIPLINEATEFNEYKVPIGLVLVGGMSVGTILTLYIVPCMHLIIHEIYHRNYIKRENYSDIVDNVILSHYNSASIENTEEEILDYDKNTDNDDNNLDTDNNNDKTELPN